MARLGGWGGQTYIAEENIVAHKSPQVMHSPLPVSYAVDPWIATVTQG